MSKEYFNKTYCIEVWGDYACFTRPEMKVERVSYDVITPSAARAIFEAIFWKPAIQWKITEIEVLNPIRWISVRRNEVSDIIIPNLNGICIDELGNDGKPKFRMQRAGRLLRDVRYRLHAELVYVPIAKRKKIMYSIPDYLICDDEKFLIDECEVTDKTGRDENPGKYNAMFERRAKKGQCFNRPYLGCREFSCSFRFVEDSKMEKLKNPPINETNDYGYMLYDIDYNNPDDPVACFFKAKLNNGAIAIPPWDSDEVIK